MADQRAAWGVHTEHEQSPQGLELTPSTAVLRKPLEAYSFQRPEPKRMSDEILTVLEVAALLKVADKTVYTMAQQGERPAFKVRGQWRFRRADIQEWMASQVARTTKKTEGPRGPKGVRK
jgi:excisionase family DNA binding protein